MADDENSKLKGLKGLFSKLKKKSSSESSIANDDTLPEVPTEIESSEDNLTPPPLLSRESEETDFPPPPPPEDHDPESGVTQNRPINLEAIKNYEMSEEDLNDETSPFRDYREFLPPDGESLASQRGFKARLNQFAPAMKSIWSRSQKIDWKNLPKKWSSGERPPMDFSRLLMKWDQFIEGFFGVKSRPRNHKFFISALFTSLAITLGSLGALILKGPPPTRPVAHRPTPPAGMEERIDFAQIGKKNLFNAKTEDGDREVIIAEEKPVIDMDKICDTANRASNLPITLLNTTVLQDSVKSIASVQVRGARSLENKRKGDKIDNLAEIGHIDRLRVILKNLSTGECEYIATRAYEEQRRAADRTRSQIVSPEEGARLRQEQRDHRIQNEGNNFRIDPSLRTEILSNIGDVLTQARAIQINNPDGTLSFKMTEIVPGSIYSQLGIQNDDIVTGINGQKINTINELMTLFGRIGDIDRFQLEIQRDGTSRSFNYEL